MKRTTTLLTFLAAIAMAVTATTTPPLPVDLSDVKEATPEIEKEMIQQALAQMNLPSQKAPARINNVNTVASDLEGCYTWSYSNSSNRTIDPAEATITGSYTADVVIYDTDDAAGTLKIAGMFNGIVHGTVDLTSYQSPTVKIDTVPLVYYSTNYPGCSLRGVFYSETNQGWYRTSPIFFVQENRLFWASNVYLVRYIKAGSSAGRNLTPYFLPGSTMVPSEAKNGVMAYNYNFDYAHPVSISEDENYQVTIANFGGLGQDVLTKFDLAADHTFSAPEGQIIYTNDNGSYVLYGYPGYVQLTGTGTENTLIFDTNWTGYDSETNYWLGNRGPATIYKIDGDFDWPPVIPTSFALNHTDDEEIALTANQTLQLSIVNVQPEDASTEVTWSSSDETIAAVDENGLVTAKVFDGNAHNQQNGNAAPVDNNYAFFPVTITATSTVADAVSASVTVYVQSSTKTGINDINASTVVNVKYVNAQGMVSSTPFDGVNIKVTTLGDGTTKIVKEIK